MKHFLLIILLAGSTSVAFSQSGTIKIAKPKKDTVIAPPKAQIVMIGHAGLNYAFKNSRKPGYQAGISFGQGSRIAPFAPMFSIGLEYSWEELSYILSFWDSDQQASMPFIGSSATSLDYLKIPFRISTNMTTDRGRQMQLTAQLKPEYLLGARNEHKRIGYSDLRQFNVSGSFALGFIIRNNYLVEIGYSKDFFDNLLDRNIYDQSGFVMGKQRSKTDLLSLTISYGF